MGIKRNVKRSTVAYKVTLDEAFEDFVQEKEAHSLSKKTIDNYRQSYEYLCEVNGYTRDTLVEDVNQQAIYKFINSQKARDVAPSSINHYIRDFRTFLYWCMDPARGYITPSFKIKEIEKQEEPLKMFTDDELQILAEKPRKGDDYPQWRTWAIVNWVMGTGNRAATICEVKIEDVNFIDKTISLRHTKNKKLQIIPLSSSLATCLKEYIRIWRRDLPPDSWLFANYGNDKLTTNALRKSFAKYCKDRGVDRTNIHGLRHNFAKAYIKNGGRELHLQKILGHSSLAMTRRYVALFNEDLKEDFDDFALLDSIKRKAKRTKNVVKAED